MAFRRGTGKYPTKLSLILATAALSLGQLAAAVQTIGAFREIQIEWVAPVASVLDLLSLPARGRAEATFIGGPAAAPMGLECWFL